MKKIVRAGALLTGALLWYGTNAHAVVPGTDLTEDQTAVSSLELDKKKTPEDEESRPKRDLGHLSGSFETNSIYYVKDKKTGAKVPKNHYGSNNFLKVDYQRGRLSAGIQLEYYPHPLVGTPAENFESLLEGFGWGNLAGKYVAWTDRNYSVTVGDFYEQFGSGLVLRAWEDRTLGFNNSIVGGRVTFNIKDIVSGKVLYGLPRYYMMYETTQIGGADLSVSLSNAIGLRDHQLSIEGSVVNRHFDGKPAWYKEMEETFESIGEEVSYSMPLNVLSYSARLNYEYNGLLAKFEYVGKSKDAYLVPRDNDYFDKNGNAQLVELGYSGDGYAVSAQFRRMRYMQSLMFRPNQSSASGILPGNTINYIPAFSTQHTYMLAGLDPNVAISEGEMAGQIDAYYTFKRGTAIGGKRGMKIHANYAVSYSLDGATAEPNDHFRYRDFSFDIDKSWNKRLRTILFVSLQKNALHSIGHYTKQNVFVLDVTYKFTPKFSLRADVEYLYAPGSKENELVAGDWVAGLVEANFAPKWSIFVQDMYNLGNPVEKLHYYSAGVSFTHSFARIALTYGRNREGMICSGGVCRLMPAYTGANLAMTLTF